jgi:ribonuclease E
VHEDFPPVPLAAEAPAPKAEPRKAPPPLELDWSSDLEQVESDPRKIKAAQREESPEEAPAPRPKRQRVPHPPLIEEPLVQIETEKRGPAADATTAKPASEETATTP